ncbi:hypothetical protein ACP70R_019810 [Stipagrostis hirtigluma subsp. patula]
MPSRTRRHARRDMTPRDASSPTAFPPDDVLREILLRLPPQPSFLLRTSFVCKHWRAVVADPGFLGQHRARHRAGGAPILGVFHNNPRVGGRFVGAGEQPDRVPAERFSPQDLGCEPATGGSSSAAAAGGSSTAATAAASSSTTAPTASSGHGYNGVNAVLFRDAGAGDDDDGHHDDRSFRFRIAVASVAGGTAAAVVYSSDTGRWGRQATADAWTSLPSEKPGAAVGEAVYWLLNDNRVLSLKLFAGGLQALSVLAAKVPSAYTDNVQLTATPDGKLGLAAVNGSALHLLALEAGDGGLFPLWTLRGNVRLDAALAPGPPEMVGEQWKHCVRIVGVH